MGHISETGGEYDLPQIGADYWFCGGTDTDREDLPVLVIYERTMKPLFGHRVAQKAVTDAIADQVVRDLDSTGLALLGMREDAQTSICIAFAHLFDKIDLTRRLWGRPGPRES